LHQVKHDAIKHDPCKAAARLTTVAGARCRGAMIDKG
jgi:hypothetical protein